MTTLFISVETDKKNSPAILIMDRDEYNNAYMALLLNTMQYRFQILDNSVQGTSFAKASKIDLIFLDLHLQPDDGLKVLREIRADSLLKDIPVIILAGIDWAGKKKDLLNAGANDYVTKPLRGDDLRMLLKKHLPVLP